MPGTLIVAAISAGLAATTASIAGATAGVIITNAVLAGGSVIAQWGINKYRKANERSTGGGSSTPDPSETSTRGGVRTASHVLGRQRLSERQFMTAYVGTHDLGNDRRAFNVIHVLSEGPCEGVEKIWIDGFLAMEAPASGANSPNGAIQYLEPKSDGWQAKYRELLAEATADGETGTEAQLTAIEELDQEDFYRFRAIQQVRARDGGNRGTNPISLRGSGSGTVYLADWGPWCKCWVYPNGITTQTHINSSKLSDDPEWKADDYRFEGKTIVHIQFERSNFDSPFTAGVPRVEYLLKGRKITWPGQTTPAWTENSAAVRYWFHTELEGINPSKIDLTEFTEAYNKCNENLTLTIDDPDDEFTKTTLRYSTNMLFLQDPTYYQRYRDDMDQCWQGFVVDARGKLYFRPGFERPVKFKIGPENIVRHPASAITQASWNDRVNTVRTVIPQSFDHDFNTFELPAITDEPARTKDGQLLEEELRGLTGVAYPVNAVNIMHIFLRRARHAGTLSLRLQLYPTDFAGSTYPQINDLDRVEVTHPFYGLKDAKYEVATWGWVGNTTMIDVELKEAPDGIYADSTVILPIKPRTLHLPGPDTPPTKVTGLTATPAASILADGGLSMTINVNFNSNDHSTELTIRNADDTFVDTFSVGPYISSHLISVPAPGDYMISARHVNERLRRSRSVSVSATVDISGLRPPAPTYASHDQRGDILTIFFQPYAQSNFNVVGLDIRYNFREAEDTSNFPAAPTEATWDSLPRFVTEPVTPVRNFSAIIPVPATGRYKIYVRAITRQGLISAIGDLGEYLLEGAAAGVRTFDAEPDWLGTRVALAPLWNHEFTVNNETYNASEILVRDTVTNGSVASATFNDWNGQGPGGWPFGAPLLQSRYTFIIDDLPSGHYNARYILKDFQPTGSVQTADFDVEFTARNNNADVGSPVNAGDSDGAFVRVLNVGDGLRVQMDVNTGDVAAIALRILLLKVS